MSTDLELVQNALTEYSKVDAGLAELAARFDGVVYDVTTTAGMKEAKEARATIREPRYLVEKIRKGAKAPLLALGKEIDGRARKITEALEAIEQPIDAQITAEEERKEAEKAARIEAERARVAAISERIDAIRNAPVRAAGTTAARISMVIADLECTSIGTEFAEFADTARRAQADAIAALTGMLEAALNAEAEAERLKAERAEQDAKAAELAAQEAAQKAEADRLAAEQKRIDDANAELARKQAEAEAEAKRAADERAAREKREADEAAERERKAKIEADAKAAEEAAAEERRAARLTRERPSDADIIQVVSMAFDADPALVAVWLKQFGGEAAKAA